MNKTLVRFKKILIHRKITLTSTFFYNHVLLGCPWRPLHAGRWAQRTSQRGSPDGIAWFTSHSDFGSEHSRSKWSAASEVSSLGPGLVSNCSRGHPGLWELFGMIRHAFSLRRCPGPLNALWSGHGRGAVAGQAHAFIPGEASHFGPLVGRSCYLNCCGCFLQVGHEWQSNSSPGVCPHW